MLAASPDRCTSITKHTNRSENVVKWVKIEVIEPGKGLNEASIVQEALAGYWALEAKRDLIP